MKFQKSLKIKDLIEFSGPLIEDHIGNLDTEITWFGSNSSKEPNAFAFISTPRSFETVEESSAVCVLAPLKMKEQI